jgi:hypothetical protein
VRVAANLNPRTVKMWRMSDELSGDELKGTNGTLVWDGLGAVRLRYGGPWITQKSTITHLLLKRLGERTVPVEALQRVELVMPGGTEDPMIRLVLREGADPITAVAGGDIQGLLDPYRFYFKNDQWLLADYYAQEIRASIARHQLATEPAEHWLVAPPEAPDEFKGNDGKLRLAGDQLVFDWGWAANAEKKKAGDPRSVPLSEITGVEWKPSDKGWNSPLGFFRITTAQSPAERPDPKVDPDALILGPTAEINALFVGAKILTLI